MSTAVTASVWGQGLAAMKLSAQAVQTGMREGDEECHICRDDIPATIAFVACKHKVCFGCVENMRAKNIFKADKGIKCPFCRQYVDGYISTRPPSAEVQHFLAEANKAAVTAAAARREAERRANPAAAQQQQQQQGQQGQQQQQQQQGGTRQQQGASSCAAAAPPADSVWNCGSCGERNFFWREFCGRCKRPCPNPYGLDAKSQTRKDLSVVTRDELVALLHDQGGFALRKGLADMGVALDGHRCYGSAQCIREAVAFYGLKKRVLHLADLLADGPTLRRASLHPLGNLGVQRMLEAAARLRTAYGPGSGRPQHPDVEAFMAAHGGKDPFGAMLAALTSVMLEMCLHEKGVYVVQCAANCASNSELVDMANAVFPLALPVSRDPRGVFVLLALLDLFSQRIWDDADNCEPALKAIDLLCQQFTISDKQLCHTGMHALSGKVVVRAIAVSMPRFPALRLAVKVACQAALLAPTSGGQFTLMELLQLYGHNQEAAEGLRDVVTCMCYSLAGQFGRFAASGDPNLHELLLCLVERLGHEQETGWLDAVIQELVGVVDQLVPPAGGQQQQQQHDATGLEILKFALTQPCLDLDTIISHIADMKSLLPKAQLLPLVGDLMERVSGNPPPPAPKYPAASAIQPQLKYLLAQGHPTPLPPPPPPRPGEPGYEDYEAQAAARAEAQAAAAAEARARRDAAAAARRDAAEAAGGREAAASSRASAVMDAWGSLRAGGGDARAAAWDAGSGGAGTPAATSNGGNPWGGGGGSGGGGGGDAWGGGGGVAVAVPMSAPVAVPVPVPVAVPVAVPVPVAVALPMPGRPPSAPVGLGGSRPMIMAAPPAPIPVAALQTSRPMSAPQHHHAPPPLHHSGSLQDAAGWPSTQQAVAGGGRSSGRPQVATQQYQQPPQVLHQQLPPLQHQRVAAVAAAASWGGGGGPAPMSPSAAAAAGPSGPWSCSACTYEHAGAEAQFLSCAICGTRKA